MRANHYYYFIFLPHTRNAFLSSSGNLFNKISQAIEALPVFKTPDLQLICLGVYLDIGDAFAVVPDCAAWRLH